MSRLFAGLQLRLSRHGGLLRPSLPLTLPLLTHTGQLRALAALDTMRAISHPLVDPQGPPEAVNSLRGCSWGQGNTRGQKTDCFKASCRMNKRSNLEHTPRCSLTKVRA